jgi:signal transduction histidine kinase
VALGQRLVDYHKDQRYLQQFFSPETVTRLLKVQERTSELEEAYAQLELLDRSKSNFIQVISHELRTPLALIKGYGQLFLATASAVEDELSRQCAEGVAEGTERLHEIVDSMLDMIEAETPHMTLFPELISMPALFAKLEQDLAEILADRDLKLTVENMGPLPEIEADPALLRKLFEHLLTNAIKYTPDGGSINVSGWSLGEPDVGARERFAEFVVSDTGIGIAPEFRELVFVKFYRTDDAASYSSGKTKFKGGGPGLGLAIARGITEAHGGRIWVESPGQDEDACPGTQFHVVLPVRQPQRAPEVNQEASP